MIIFDEREYVKTILKEKKKPPKMATKRLIVYLCRYFYEENKNQTASTFQKNILEKLKEFDFNEAEYEEYKFSDYIKTICKKLLSGDLDYHLKEIRQLNFTETELRNVRSCETEREQKLLFTFYALAKTYNNPTGWVNYQENDIFELANIRMTAKEKILLIKKLCDRGYIQYNRIINKNSYKVILDEDENIAMTITSFQNIGNQFLIHEKDGLMICENCGKIIKRTSNSRKYCKRCAAIIKIKQSI